MRSWTGDAGSSTPESSSGTASKPTTERLVSFDPGATTGFAFVARDNEPVPYAQRLSFWERAKARRAERLEQEARENKDISAWLAEKAPTRTERIAQDTVDTIVQYLPEDGLPSDAHWRWQQNPVIWAEGESDVMALLNAVTLPTPISSARSPLSREFVAARIQMMTVDVDEVFWDVVSMIDAHRNGATALDRPDYVEQIGDDPVWQDLTTRKWDPTKERGPREVDYVRKMAKS